MTLFRLGRLQFEHMSSEWEFIWNGISVKKGNTVISIHIPEGILLHRRSVWQGGKLGSGLGVLKDLI